MFQFLRDAVRVTACITAFATLTACAPFTNLGLHPGAANTLIVGDRQEDPDTLKWEALMPAASAAAVKLEQDRFLADLKARYGETDPSDKAVTALDQIQEGSALDMMPQMGGFETVPRLDGEYVRIPGYIVPLDLTSRFRQSEFLFVPHKGACIHSPPPPPNQIILIRSKTPFRLSDIWVPYWVEGELHAEPTHNDLGDAAYSMNVAVIERYEEPQYQYAQSLAELTESFE